MAGRAPNARGISARPQDVGTLLLWVFKGDSVRPEADLLEQFCDLRYWEGGIGQSCRFPQGMQFCPKKRALMLHGTFRHLPRVSDQQERNLWRHRVLSWDQLDPQLALFEFDEKRNGREKVVRESIRALSLGDADFFARRLPKSEHYRIAYTFPTETLFLDIETTGLSLYYDHITLIGWSLGGDYGVFVQGEKDQALRGALSKSKALVTFNGSLFDLKFVRKEFPNLRLPQAHIDLRFLARRFGYRGGQKTIEEKIGLERPTGIRGLSGTEAPVLWHRYRRGDLNALHTLIEYNHADIEGMKQILDLVVRKLVIERQFPDAMIPKRWFDCLRSSIQWSNGKRSATGHKIQVGKYRGPAPKFDLTGLQYRPSMKKLRVVGIDLTGSEKRESGWCFLTGSDAETLLVRTDENILQKTIAARPHLVSIDSPLSLPKGRTRVTDDDPGRTEFGIMRVCERVLKKRGINVYPSLLPSMQQLTARGIRLTADLRKVGIPVIESYPGSAQDIMGIPRKRAGLDDLRAGLVEFGVRGPWDTASTSHDELDAITSAIVGVFFWSGMFEPIGSIEENFLIIPKLDNDASLWRKRRVVGFSGLIAAGKTTAAETLRKKGFHYARFSQVLASLLEERGEKQTRQSLQRLGQEIHHLPGQRWLCARLLESIPENGDIVIDGLRHPEDHAFFVEQYGPGFLHLFVDASAETRLRRYCKLGFDETAFFEATDHVIESNVSKLADVAHEHIVNNHTKNEFTKGLDKIQFQLEK